MTTATSSIIETIFGIDDPGELSRISDALRARSKELESRKAWQFKRDDKVVFNSKASPKYLIGVTGVVKKVNKTRAIVAIGPDGGRFANSQPSCPFAIIDKI